MKKVLLFSLAAITAMGMQAEWQSPLTVGNQNVRLISPDGRYVVSENYGAMTIYDMLTGQNYEYANPEDSWDFNYSAGNGCAFSSNGILVGSTSAGTTDAAWWKDGEWHHLPVLNAMQENCLGGISRDGKMIVGFIWNPKAAGMTDEDNVMMTPYYWELGEDGEYGQPQALPYPQKDFTGRTPQYVSALCVSADKNVIAGQVRDYSGQFTYPIVYTRNSEGEWSYKMPNEELLNPNKVVCPEDPGEGPTMPDVETFMTIEEIDAYNTAVKAWEDEGSWDYSTYPDMADFISEQGATAYNEEVAKYNELAEAYNEKFEAFELALQQIMLDGLSCVFNDQYMSGDGRYLLQTGVRSSFDDPVEPTYIVQNNAPVLFDLQEGSYSELKHSQDLTITGLADDGTVFAKTTNQVPNPYVYVEGGKWITFQEWIDARHEDAAQWVRDNMYHDYDVMDYITGETTSATNAPVMGHCAVSANLHTLALTRDNVWDFNDENYSYTHVLLLEDPSAVKTVDGVESFEVSVLADAVIKITGKADVKVFDLQGRNVFASEDVEGCVKTGLNSGVYVVRASKGSLVRIIKVVL